MLNQSDVDSLADCLCQEGGIQSGRPSKRRRGKSFGIAHMYSRIFVVVVFIKNKSILLECTHRRDLLIKLLKHIILKLQPVTST